MESASAKELPDLQTLQKEAAHFAESLVPGTAHATLATLSGELGAGKTSFTQGAARALGVMDEITSPTFVLQKIYMLAGQKFARLVHMDAYRLEGDTSLAPLGFDELYADPATLIMLEWPEKVQGQIPVADCHIQFDITEEGRTISYTYAR